MAKYDVFISYSRKDSELARGIYHTLRKAGISCFHDYDILIDGNNTEQITKVIKNSKVFLFLLSSSNSDYSNKELQFAIQNKNHIKILPYIIEESKSLSLIKILFGDTRCISINQHPIGPELVEVIKKLLDNITSKKEQAEPKPYQVFISCKSEDYNDAKEIYTFLTNQCHYRVFLADTELRKSGRTKYGKVIDEALEQAEHLILYTSKIEYVTTPYVEDEWRTFLEEQRSGRKKGNLCTILKNCSFEELPISLRHLQYILYDEFQSVVDYLPIDSVCDNANNSKTYQVGDYYNENGKQGVVFEVSADGQHGKIVSMTQSTNKLQWSSITSQWDFIGADSKTDGTYNMAKVKAVFNWQSKYPAFKWCADLGEGWYLPSIEELKKFTLNNAVYDAVNRTLASKGGVKLYNPGDAEGYWSSTESDELWYGKFCAWLVGMCNGYALQFSMDFNSYVRAVSAF